MATEVIPFGKYKGQPVEAMAADQQYIDWLMGQSWFRDKYQNIYTLIVNNFTEPSETPEHNALQATFLDQDACLSIAEAAGVTDAVIGHARNMIMRQPYNLIEDVDKWKRNYDYHIKELTRYRDTLCGNVKPRYSYETDEFLEEHARGQEERAQVALRELQRASAALDEDADRRRKEAELVVAATAKVADFEYCGWDVSIKVQCRTDFVSLFLELKPSLGDDYPAVLRQMRANARTAHVDNRHVFAALVIREFCATGATIDQVRKIFEVAGFRMVVCK